MFGTSVLSSSTIAPFSMNDGTSTEIGKLMSYPPPSSPSFAYASSVFEKKLWVTLVPYFASKDSMTSSAR